MIRIHPLAAERPPAELAMRVASVPYDVVSTEEARTLVREKPESFLHVVRPEIDLPPETDPYSEIVYEKGRDNLQRFRDTGLLQMDEEPAIYLYRITWQGRSQTGVVCCCDAEQYRAGLVKRHEFTQPDKELDRTRHLLVSGAHAEPVLLAFHDDPTISELIREGTTSEPSSAFEAEDGVMHECWRVANPEEFIEAFGRLDALYIADGHHRSAAAERAARDLMNANPDHTGSEEYNRLLAVCFPATELSILPYNRVVHDLFGLSSEEFLERLALVGELEPTEDAVPRRSGEVCVFVAGSWHRLTFDPKKFDKSDSICSLDCALLQSLVLEPILGISDPRTDKRVGFVGGIHSTEELQRRAGESGVAFSMHPTSMMELLKVADSGLTMPPKSTWFEPKLRSGLFVHRFSGS